MTKEFWKLCLIVVVVLGANPPVDAGFTELGDLLDNVNAEYELAAIVRIKYSRVLRSPEMESSCGIHYRAEVLRHFGDSDNLKIADQFSFISDHSLATDSQYLLFIRSETPFSLQNGQIAINQSYNEAMKLCASMFASEASEVAIGIGPVVFQLTRPVGRSGYDWIHLDTSKYQVDPSANQYIEDIEHCASDDDLRSKNCELMHRRILVPLEYVLKRFDGSVNTQNEDTKKK